MIFSKPHLRYSSSMGVWFCGERLKFSKVYYRNVAAGYTWREAYKAYLELYK